MNLVDWLIKSLWNAAEVKTFFGVSGANIEDFFDSVAVRMGTLLLLSMSLVRVAWQMGILE